ncbi:MAG: hypothetical protein ACRCX2_16910, partial [Paraclostridium sp.]
WRNYGLWCSILALVFLLLQDFGVIVTPERFTLYTDTVMSILIIAGIVSNPKEGNFFMDKE